MSSESLEDVEATGDLASFVVLNPSTLRLMESQGCSSESTKDKRKLKHKLRSVWNNVKYGGWSLKSKPRLSKTSDVYLLGHKYHLSHTGSREQFRQMFSSLFWLTYRRDFVRLDGSSLTSDCGWGCTLRSAQMLLAQGLLLHILPPGWRWQGAQQKTKDDLEIRRVALGSGLSGGVTQRRLSDGAVLDEGQGRSHRRLLRWFGDTPSAPYGLHRLVQVGGALGKRAGDWYGPAIAAHILRKSVSASHLTDLTVYVAQDCTVYMADVLKLYEEPHWVLSRCRSIILLVPVRLGGEALNSAYIPCVQRLLELKCCIGIIGGKPKHSLYFVGFQDDQLLYLDPHVCQAAVDMTQDNFPLESFHCKTARKLPFQRMDPSCTLGFYAKSRRDLDTLRSDVTTALAVSTETYPIFTFVDGSGQNVPEEAELTFDPEVTTKHRKKTRQRCKKLSSTDEFVLL